MGPKINARQQRHVGALDNILGETQVRGSPGCTQRSPRLTSAAPDGGERRRPMLTRQNRKGNIEPSSLIIQHAVQQCPYLAHRRDARVSCIYDSDAKVWC
jgi:hypothetical protein